jgi:hypothetical protein
MLTCSALTPMYHGERCSIGILARSAPTPTCRDRRSQPLRFPLRFASGTQARGLCGRIGSLPRPTPTLMCSLLRTGHYALRSTIRAGWHTYGTGAG